MSYLYKPKGIVIHCTASNNKYTLEQLYKDHIRRGFDMIGYHYVIQDNGTIVETRPLNMIGAHAKGYNDYIGIAYIGGIDTKEKPKNTISEYQKDSLGTLLYAIMEIYIWNSKNILLHNEIANKACPSFKRDFLYKILEEAQPAKEPYKLLNNIKQYGLCVHNR